jgi:hypothetical protein
MSCYITIPNISGTPPYQITVCDNNNNNCFLAAYELSYVPPTIYVDVPSDWSGLPFVIVSVQSSEGCEEIQFVPTTPTPTPTPTATSVGPTPTPTITPSITPSITPTKSVPVPPYFQVQNINGANPQSITLNAKLNSKFTVDFGDGTAPLNYSITSPSYTGSTNLVALSKSYVPSDYITTIYDLRYGSPTFPNSADGLRDIYVDKISKIFVNDYTFTAFTSLDGIYITNSTVDTFKFALTNAFDVFTYQYNSATTFDFEILNPTSITQLQNVYYRYNNFTSATINYSGYTTTSRPASLVITNNSSLTNLNFAPPQSGGVIYIYDNGQLSDINFITPLSSSTTVSRIDLHANRFTGWTTNFPTQVSRIDMEQQQGGFSLGVNSFRYFSPNLSNNTGLTQLNLYTNSLTSITETISGCTSLTNLRVDRNYLTTLPPQLPNSISTLIAHSNYFTGYTSNFPTSMNYFNINKGSGNPSLPTWNVEISGATNLQTFLANSVGLTAWTKNFPTSIVTIDLSENSLTSFLNSISGNTSLVTLSLNNNNLTSIPPIFPNSIQTLELQNNDLTGYTSNIPTSLVTFSIENQFVIGNYIPEWSQELTGSTNLNSFDISRVGLTGWTKTFPSSIRTINFSNNNLTNINFGLMTGGTNINLGSNSTLSAATNLSAVTNLVTLSLDSTGFKNSSDIIQGNFPKTLKNFAINNSTNLSGWTNSFSALTGFTYGYFYRTNLKTAAVDFLLEDFYKLATANTLTNKTLLFTGTTSPQPESPTGGLTNPYYLALKSSPYNWTVTVKP